MKQHGFTSTARYDRYRWYGFLYITALVAHIGNFAYMSCL